MKTPFEIMQDEVIELKKELIERTKELKISLKIFTSTPDPTQARGIKSKKSTVNLFETDDITEDKHGITIWNGDDVYDIENNDNILEEEE